MRILITGFEPFGGQETNASWEAVRRCPDVLESVELIKEQLPVVYDSVGKRLEQLIGMYRPDAVLCIGQAKGRTSITPEKIAINWKASKSLSLRKLVTLCLNGVMSYIQHCIWTVQLQHSALLRPCDTWRRRYGFCENQGSATQIHPALCGSARRERGRHIAEPGFGLPGGIYAPDEKRQHETAGV